MATGSRNSQGPTSVTPKAPAEMTVGTLVGHPATLVADAGVLQGKSWPLGISSSAKTSRSANAIGNSEGWQYVGLPVVLPRL